MRGGTQTNIVPDHCVIGVDRRTLPGETEAGTRREVAAFLRARKLRRAKVANVKLKPCSRWRRTRVCRWFASFCAAPGQARARGLHYFCDAAVLARGGIPSVVFGPGDIAQAHTADEWIALAQLERGRDLLLRFLKSLP